MHLNLSTLADPSVLNGSGVKKSISDVLDMELAPFPFPFPYPYPGAHPPIKFGCVRTLLEVWFIRTCLHRSALAAAHTPSPV